MRDFSSFAGTRFMIRGTHPWAGWVGAFIEFRRCAFGTCPVLKLESRNAMERQEVFILEPGHIRRAGDHEIGTGGKP